MAKTRGGLGRGLNSLLGGGMNEMTMPEQQTNSQAFFSEEETAHDAVEPAGAEPAPVQEPAGTQPQSNEGPAAEAPKEQPREIEEVNEDIIEDNVVIKGVATRPAAPKAFVREVRSESPTRDSAEISIDLIEPNPDQPRTSFKKEELEELAESIKKNGLLQPILVRSLPNGRYQIIAGERRWQACKNLGMAKVPVRIREVDDDKTIMLALVENIQRSDLNPIEEAYGYRRMMERGKMTQAEVAQAVSKGRSTIANALRLLELPEDAQQLLFEERITAGHARAILSIPTQEGRRKLTDKLVESQLSVRETENLARLLSGKKEKSENPRPQAPKSYRTVARALGDALGTDVKIKSVKGKNRIEIDFKDEADLERLFRVITAGS